MYTTNDKPCPNQLSTLIYNKVLRERSYPHDPASLETQVETLSEMLGMLMDQLIVSGILSVENVAEITELPGLKREAKEEDWFK